jgi:mono/diheme cytochrome c family protein
MMSDTNKLTHTMLITFLATAMFLGDTEIGLGQASSSSGADTYRTHCVSCHGTDGHGSAVGKSLHVADLDSPQVQQQSDAQLMDVIKNGRGNMPPFSGSLSETQIASVIQYIRTLKKTK